MRINFFGGPGSGKSTTAAWLFSEMKMRNMSVELVNEYVKKWAYLNRPVQKFDQIYIFGKQIQAEYTLLANGVKNIVTDSPLMLSYFYAPFALRKSILDLHKEYEKDFPSLNILLDRGNKPYDPKGRYQTYERAKQADIEMIRMLAELDITYYTASYTERTKIMDIVEHVIQNP